MASTIRRAVSGDAAAVRELTRAAYAKWVPVIGREPLPMAADYERAVADHLIDLLIDDRRLVALVEMIPEADCLLIENLAVRPAAQGMGHGRQMLENAEEVARSLGFTTIRLYTNLRFTENLQIYARLGYRVDRQEAFRGGVVVHMSKTVTSRQS